MMGTKDGETWPKWPLMERIGEGQAEAYWLILSHSLWWYWWQKAQEEEKEKQRMNSKFQGATWDWQGSELLSCCVRRWTPIERLQTAVTTVMSVNCESSHVWSGSSDVAWLRLESPFTPGSILCEERAWWLAGCPGLGLTTQQVCSGLFPWLQNKIPTWKWPLESEALNWDGIHPVTLSYPKQVTGLSQIHREKLQVDILCMGKVTAVISLPEWLIITRWLSK